MPKRLRVWHWLPSVFNLDYNEISFPKDENTHTHTPVYLPTPHSNTYIHTRCTSTKKTSVSALLISRVRIQGYSKDRVSSQRAEIDSEIKLRNPYDTGCLLVIDRLPMGRCSRELWTTAVVTTANMCQRPMSLWLPLCRLCLFEER